MKCYKVRKWGFFKYNVRLNIKNLLTLSLVFFMMPNYIFAQDDESADVEEVIVTATKRETNLIKEDILKATEYVLDSGNYILGEKVKEFEEKFASYCGVSDAIAVGNGSDGLKFIMKSLGIGQNDEVICPANSFIASAWAIIDAGAKPVFCDEENDLLISVETADLFVSIPQQTLGPSIRHV